MDWTTVYKPERKASWEDIANAIHDSVTMWDVIRMYCPDLIPRQHRIPCPIHNGKDYNFSFTDSGYKCFVCNETGDVVKFVQTVCQLRSRVDAMTQICRDFGLPLTIDREISFEENKALEERRKAAEEKERKREEWERGLSALWDEWCRLDRQRMFCAAGSDAWAEAVKNIDRIAYEIDCYPAESG